VIADPTDRSRGPTLTGPCLVAAPDDRARFQEFTMTKKPKQLSETARALLTAAAARDDHLIRPP
jgi:hypothetical protein